MANRRILFLPFSLVVIVAIALAALYLGYRAPHVVTAVVILGAIVVGGISFVFRYP